MMLSGATIGREGRVVLGMRAMAASSGRGRPLRSGWLLGAAFVALAVIVAASRRSFGHYSRLRASFATMILAACLGACGDSAPTPPPRQEPVNRAPVTVGSIAALVLTAGDTTTLNVASYFNDPDGDALTYSASLSDSGVASATVAGPVVTVRARA